MELRKVGDIIYQEFMKEFFGHRTPDYFRKNFGNRITKVVIFGQLNRQNFSAWVKDVWEIERRVAIS